MGIQFKQGVLELCILSLLIKRDYFGYELVSALSAKFKLKESAVYPLLRKMTLEQYIEAYVAETEADHVSRKYYRITGKGLQSKQQLSGEWLDLIGRVNDVIKED